MRDPETIAREVLYDLRRELDDDDRIDQHSKRDGLGARTLGPPRDTVANELRIRLMAAAIEADRRERREKA